MKKFLEVAGRKKLSASVADGSCRICLPCAEWMSLRKIDGCSQLHLTASKGVDELLTKTYDLQPTKAGYYLVDEDTASDFVSMVSDSIVNSAVIKCKGNLSDFASRLELMECTEQRLTGTKRVGQDKLRQLLLMCIGQCEISGIRDKDLLVVSHIKPWEDCVDGGSERLDSENVLLLAANWDALFDKKFISFDPQTGKMIKSERVDDETLRKFGVPEDWCSTVRIQIKTQRRKQYLKWHLKAMREKDMLQP